MARTALLRIAATVTALGTMAAPARAQAVSFRTIAHTGAAAPISGATYGAVADPTLGENGVITFWARLVGAEVTAANDGVWLSDRGGQLSAVVREGDTFDGSTILSVPSVAVNESGWAYPVLTLSTPNEASAPNLALAVSRSIDGVPQELESILRDTTSNPFTFDVPYRPLIRPAGAVYWSSSTGVWRSDSTTRLVARNPVAGIELLGGTSTWRFNGFCEPSVDDIGRLVFWGAAGPNTSTPSTDALQKTGLWRSDGGTPWLLVGEGLQVSGSPAGQVWKQFGARPRMFAGGVLFWARVGGTGVGSDNDTSLMQVSDSGLVRGRIDAGQEFPGAPGERFGPIPQNFSVNFMRGEAVLVVPVRNAPAGTNTALVFCDEGASTIIARRGDQAPGLPEGVAFDNFQKPVINDASRVAFVAGIRGAGVSGTNNRVLFAMNRFAELVPVVRTGDLYTLPDGPTKTIRRVIFQEESTLLGRSAYNSGGQLIFGLDFTDNSEALVLASVDCAADVNRDGAVDGDDIIAFFVLWDVGNSGADVDGSGFVDGDDVIFFFARFDAGC